MSRPPGGSRVGTGTGRRVEIVREAARLFDERGFHGTSMDDIAAAVGIKKATLYHHVSSKSEIVLWIHDELADELLTRLSDVVRRDVPPTATLLIVLLDVLTLHDRKPGHLRVYFEQHRELPPVQASASRRKRDRYFALLEDVIARGAAAGEFDVTDTRLSALAFFGMCNWCYQWYRPGGTAAPSDIALSFWRTFLSGIGTPGVPHVSAPS